MHVNWWFDWLEAEEEENGDKEGTRRRWLVIVDNLDTNHLLDQALQEVGGAIVCTNPIYTKTLREYLPRQLHRDQVLLVTTRSRDVARAMNDSGSWINIKERSIRKADGQDTRTSY
jgi:hypothetical protein